MYVQISIHTPAKGQEAALIDSMHRYGAAAKTQPGLVRVHTLKDDRSGKLVGLAVWESEAGKKAAQPALDAAVEGDDFSVLEEEPIAGFSLREV